MTNTFLDPGWLETVAGVCPNHGDWSYQRPFHRPGVDRAVPEPECQDCRKARHDAEEAERERLDKERRRREDIERRIANVQAPPRFEDVTFDGFGNAGAAQRRTAEIVRKFAEGVSSKTHAGRWLILIGPPGVGKTHLGIAAALAVARSQNNATYFRLPDLLLGVRASYSKGSGESEGGILASITAHRLIVVDEILDVSEHGRRLLFELIDDRYRRGLPLILISNSTRAELEVIVGERAADRIAEQGTFLACEWPSYRRRGGGAR